MKVYVVCEDHGYDGYSEPVIATIFPKSAMAKFKELVDVYRKDTYPPYLIVYEYDETDGKEIARWQPKRGARGEVVQIYTTVAPIEKEEVNGSKET